MDLPPFLLDQWLAAYEFRTPPVRYNLASSTGPRWTLKALEGLDQTGWSLSEISIGYAPPDGSLDLRRAIADHHDVDPDWVVVTTGASEALSILFCLASKPGGSVSLPSPAFPAFAAMAGAWQLDVENYELRRDKLFRHASDLVLQSLRHDTVLAVVNTPHNPTGSVMARPDIEILAAALAERNVPLIVDEVYHPLYFGHAQRSAAGIENVIVISDMSKALSLAGLRLGWVIDADPERRKRIVDARSYFTISSSPIAEAVAAHALRNRSTLLSRLNAVASTNLVQLRAVIEEASDIVSWVAPDGSTTAYPWFNDGRDSRPFCEALAERGVLIVPGDCFGARDHMRIGFGAQDEGFKAAASILRDAIMSEI